MNKMIFALSMVAAAAVGCSTMPRQEARHAGNLGVESRGASSVHPKRARALVSGPVVVKHLETEGDGAVTLYLADDPGIAIAPARARPPRTRRPSPSWSGRAVSPIWSSRPASGSAPPPPPRTR